MPRALLLALLLLASLRLAMVVHMAMMGAGADERRGVEARASPRMGVAPLVVLLYVFSDEPGLTCPSIKVEWAEGNTSFQDSDCDPDDLPETFSFSRRSPGGYGPGNHGIRITLEQGRKRIVRVAEFYVAGGE